MAKIKIARNPNLTDKRILSIMGEKFNDYDVQPAKIMNTVVEGTSVLISQLFVINIRIKQKKDRTLIIINSAFNTRSFLNFLLLILAFVLFILPVFILLTYIAIKGKKHESNVEEYLKSKTKELKTFVSQNDPQEDKSSERIRAVKVVKVGSPIKCGNSNCGKLYQLELFSECPYCGSEK